MAIPTIYGGLYCSIAASPKLSEWPVEVREWIFLRCILPSKSPTGYDEFIFSREFLGLE